MAYYLLSVLWALAYNWLLLIFGIVAVVRASNGKSYFGWLVAGCIMQLPALIGGYQLAFKTGNTAQLKEAYMYELVGFFVLLLIFLIWCFSNKLKSLKNTAREIKKTDFPTERVAICQVCSREIPANCLYCPYCGVRIDVKSVASRKRANTTAAPKRKRKAALIVAVSLFIMITSVAGVYYETYTRARAHALVGNFTHANKLLIARPITKLHDPLLLRYEDAGLTAISGDYEAAEKQFQALALIGYADSQQRVYWCRNKAALAKADTDVTSRNSDNSLKNQKVLSEKEIQRIRSELREHLYSLYNTGAEGTNATGDFFYYAYNVSEGNNALLVIVSADRENYHSWEGTVKTVGDHMVLASGGQQVPFYFGNSDGEDKFSMSFINDGDVAMMRIIKFETLVDDIVEARAEFIGYE